MYRMKMWGSAIHDFRSRLLRGQIANYYRHLMVPWGNGNYLLNSYRCPCSAHAILVVAVSWEFDSGMLLQATITAAPQCRSGFQSGSALGAPGLDSRRI